MIQVVVSVLLVAAVLWFLWRLPRAGDWLYPWGPPLALLSAWTGLTSLAISGLLWVLPLPDLWLTALMLALDPAAAAAGVGVLWIYRGADDQPGEQTIAMQRTQAWVGIALASAAVATQYAYVMTHKAPFTPVGV